MTSTKKTNISKLLPKKKQEEKIPDHRIELGNKFGYEELFVRLNHNQYYHNMIDGIK
jgi:hypothetical protein